MTIYLENAYGQAGQVEGEKNADQGQSQLSQPEVVGPLPISWPRGVVTLSDINVVFDIMY